MKKQKVVELGLMALDVRVAEEETWTYSSLCGQIVRAWDDYSHNVVVTLRPDGNIVRRVEPADGTKFSLPSIVYWQTVIRFSTGRWKTENQIERVFVRPDTSRKDLKKLIAFVQADLHK